VCAFLQSLKKKLIKKSPPMNLQEFVKGTLTQVVAGIREAQTSNPDGWAIAPEIDVNYDEAAKLKILLDDSSKQPIYLVEFDVAVTATEGKDTKGGIGVVAGIVNLGSQGASSESNSSISRVKFTVPIKMPHKNHKPPEE
jgi:hypothetical protein